MKMMTQRREGTSNAGGEGRMRLGKRGRAGKGVGGGEGEEGVG